MAQGSADSLSAREQQVLSLMAKGLSNRQIGKQLNILERSVKYHATNIFSKLGVASRTQAALWYERNKEALSDE